MIKNALLIVTSIFIFVGCASEQALNKPLKDADVYVVLLAGQSNMEGAGNYDALDRATQQRIKNISNRVMVSNRGSEPSALSFTLSSYKKDKYGFEKVFGPEMFIGLSLAEAFPNKKFLFIKTAYGGTSLYGAWSANWTSEKAIQAEKGYKEELPLYNMFKENVSSQLAVLDAKQTSYKIIGMAWMQGENDAGKEFSALSYHDNLIQFIKQNRLNANESEMPFVIGQINSTYGRFKKGPGVVRQAMVNIANNDPNTAIVLTSTNSSWNDFPKHSDNTHYNTEGQKRLGRSFASELLTLIN